MGKKFLLMTFLLAIIGFCGTSLSAQVGLQITTEQGLRDFAVSVNEGNSYYGEVVTLANDITLTGEWTPIGTGSRSSKSYSGNAFKGVFDGGNKTISDLTITSTTADDAAVGLFGVVDGGTVKNLNLTDVNINVASSDLAGAAIGMMINGATADKITVSGAIVGNDGVGGIVGRLIIDGTISNCINNASVTSSYGGIGGIVGKAYYEDGANTSTFASVTNCTNNGTVTAPMYIGGIVGLARANVTDCTNNGAVVGGTQTGGIVGQLIAAGTISGNENKAKVSGKNHLGGIIGDYSQSSAYTYYNVSIANNINRGELAATEQCAAIMGCNNIDGFTDMTAIYNVSYYYVEGLELFGNPEDMVIDPTNKFIVPVAKIDDVEYSTLAEAVEAAKSGDEIIMLSDATLDSELTLPAGITFNGNGKQINGNIVAAGDLSFVGHTKVTSFNAGYNKPVITISEGACLEIIGTGRMVIGHGATFNINGNIVDAKTADKATLTPSLVMPGASFTGAGVTFNVTNAYISAPSSYCSSSKTASGTFDFNITNSIWDSAGKLAFEAQSTAAKVDFALVNSVLTTGSHLVFGTASGEEGVVIDNSLVNQGTSRQIENRGTMTIKNGSVVNGAVATSSNAINPGTIIVENATYAVTGEFSGSDLGTGTLIVKKGATVSAGSITKANIQIDATGMTIDDEINLTANLANHAGTLEVVNNDNLTAKIVDGKIVLAERPAAKIGNVEYTTLEAAFKAATSGCTIDILSDATVDYNWDARYTGGKFTVPVTINGNDKTIKFTASVNDNNYQAPFRFEADATVKDLIIDMSEVTDNRFRAISSKGNLTVDGCKFIGKDETLNCRAVIFGEGAGTNVGNLVISITNSEFINWKRGITDNENAQDVKTVTITGNTLTDAGVGVSAKETVTFTGNTVAGAYVNIKSYTAGNKLAVTATGNTLESNTDSAYNVIDAGGKVEADGFKIIAKGNDFTGYTRGDAIWGEVWGNAKESFVIKVLDANGNVMGTTSLNNVGGIINGNVNVTWSLKLDAASNTDEYWTMEWTTAPTIDNMPAKVELWVDGVKVSGGNVVLNGPDEIAKIYAAVTDASGKILGYHTDIQEAIKAAAAVTSVAKTATAGTVEILRDVTVDKWIMFSETLNISSGQIITMNIDGLTINGNGKTVTIKSIESAGNGNRLFYDATNLNIKDLTINYVDAAANQGGIGLTAGTIENVTFNGGGNAILPGTGDITVKDCTFKTNGTSIYYEEERDNLVVTGNTFENPDNVNVILLRGNTTFTDNTVISGRTVNVVSGSPVVSGNDFNDVRFKVYNEATATISDNEINNLVFNETNAPAASTFANNTLSEEAQAAIDALPALAGEGTEANPYTISNLAQLKAFRDDVNARNNYKGKYVALTADIDLNNEEWTPIGNNTNQFQGYFDGNEKTISNLKISGNNRYVGLFGYIKGQGMSASTTPSVKDLTLENVNVSGDYYVGGLSGQAYTCNITNVTVKGEVSGVRYVGGLVGHVYTYFKDCHFIGNASCSFDALGGIAGAGDCRAYDCSVIGDVTGSNWVGGIVGNGQEGTSAVGCYVKGDVKTSNNYYRGVGGIAGVAGHGYASSEFKNNYFDGEVYLGDVKIPAMIMGLVNANDNASIKATVEGNSWNTDYYDVNTPVYVVAEISSSDASLEDWIAGTSKELTKPRNNNLVMLESDLQYVTEEDYVIMSFSEVKEEQVEQALINNAVAKIDETTYTTLQKALDAAVAGTGNVTVEIIKNIDLTGIDWNPVTVSAPGYPSVTVNGNDKTITGLNDMLFAGTWAGNSGLIINDLTIANSNIVNDENDANGNIGVGAFIGFPQASETITLNNCHLVNSTVKGGHWTGGLIGYAAGYAGPDGPVFMNLTITGCSVTGSTITGKGSAGGIIGHGSGNAWTNVVIEETTVSNNTITSTGTSTNKAGAIMGTIGAAGQPTTVNGVTHTGGATVSATVSGNTVKSNNVEITTIYGRQGTPTGMLELNGGSYDKYPIEEDVTYAAPVEGYEIVENTNGTYGVEKSAVAKIGDVEYKYLQAAFDAAQNDATIMMIADVTVAEEVIIDNTEKAVTLDMNGKTWNGAIKPSNAKLTIKNGTINNENASISAIEITYGELNLNGVNIASARHAVRIDGDVEATINGGTYKAAQGSGKGTYHAANISGNANVTITDGKFVGPKGTSADSGSALKVQSSATVTIEGGDFSGGKNHTLSADGNLIVKGGTFDQNPSDYVPTGYTTQILDNGKYEVLYAIASIGTKYYGDLHEAMVAAKSGETVKLVNDVDLAGTEWEPVSFKGIFDGQDHIISNLTINKPGVSNTGFITSLNGTFKNVTFTNPTVTGGDCTAVVAGRAGGGAAYAHNITINGTIKVETTHSGYARTGGIVGGWAYGKYENITIDGGDKATSYIKHTGGGDGRYVAGIVGHADDVESYTKCTVKNITISGGWLCGGIAGPGPADGLATGCSVENIDMGADNSGGMFGWYYGDGTIKDATVKDVTFTDGSTCNGAIGGYSNNEDATVKNVTIDNVKNENGKPIFTFAATIADGTDIYYYATLEAAFTAATEGQTITLLGNCDLSETIKVNNNITLDLNGDTITGTDNATGSFALIEIQPGAELIIEDSSEPSTGNITLTSTNNREWNAYSSVISNQRGKLTVNGGTIEHLGGTDMAYGIDNLTNGKGTYAETVINGGTIKSTYRGIRQFLNGIEAQNILTVNGGTIEGTNKSIWMQDPNKNANTGILTVGEEANLIGNVYLYVTPNSTSWPVEVSIAAGALAEGSEIITGNVPAGYELKLVDGVYSVCSVEAKIGEVTYATLAAAVNAANEGDTITLVTDITFTEATRTLNSGSWYDGLYYIGDKSFTIDLDGYTIGHDNSVNDYLLNFKNDGAKANVINLINGTIEAGSTAYCALATSSSNTNKITINTENINIINNNSNGSTIKVRGGVELNVNAGTVITGKDSYLGIECVASTVNIYDGAEIYMNDDTSYNGCLVGACANGTVNVYGGYGKGVKGGFIAMTSGGTINVAGGEWIANTDGTVGDNSNLYVLTAQNNKNESGYAGASIINVTGGKFRGGMDAWVLNDVNVEKAELNIRGGNFNADPTSYVVSDNYKVVNEDDGTYTVEVDGFEKFYTAAGVETTSDDAAYSLSFTVTDYASKEVSVKIGNKNPAENKGCDLLIPSSVKFNDQDFAVTSIPVDGFKECKGFDKLVVPGTITSVSSSAFYNCSRLTEVVIEEGVKKLGSNTFYKISDLQTLTLPSTLTRIESLCFRSTNNIETIVCNAQTPPTAVTGSFTESVYKNALLYVDGKYEDYKAANGWSNFKNILAVGATQTIDKDRYTLIATITDVWNRTCSVQIGTAPTNTKRAELAIPEHVSFSGIEFDITSIPGSGFQGCKYFEGTLTIPAYITSIGEYAFEGCSAVTALVVEEGVTSLGTGNTFKGCLNIETITLPSTLTKIPTGCFNSIHGKLQVVECHALVPPTASKFTEAAYKSATLYVHDVDAYKGANNWKLFKSIRLIGAVAQNKETEVEYKSIAEAVAAANAGETVQMLQNVDLENTITVAADKEVVLDLNGKTVSYTTTEYKGEAMITNNGNLTINDSAEGGKLSYAYEGGANSSYGFGNSTIENKGVLTINAGTVENTSAAMSHASYAINTGAGATLNVEGGNILNLNGHAVRMVSFGTELNTVNINGGYIEGTRALQVQLPGSASSTTKPAMDLNITGGELMSNEETYNLAIYVFSNGQSAENVSVEISGGTFNGNVAVNAAATNSMLANAVAITDGTFNGVYGVFSYSDEDAAQAVISITGGTFATNNSEWYAEDDYYVFEENEDGTYTVVEQTIFTQTTQLNAGWNWFSAYVDIENNGLSMIQNELGTNGLEIKKQGDFSTYDKDLESWFGTFSISNKETILINVTESQELTIVGEIVNPEDHTITLNSNWNWIGYPLNKTSLMSEAFEQAGLVPSDGDVVKYKDNFASYLYIDESTKGWIGDFDMNPGEGFMYMNNSELSKQLTYKYPTNSNNRSETRANVTTEVNHWTPNASQYPNNMTMMAMVDIEGGDYEVAAFVDGEVRGSARPIYVEPIDAYVLLLTIHGEGVEEMTFKFYDLTTGEEFDLNDRMNYSDNAIVGSLKEPYMFNRGTTGIGEAAMSEVNIYPNPTTTGTEINLQATCDKVEVFNALGVKLAEYQNVDSIDALETAGIYVIRITNNGNVQNCRLVVK